MPVSRATMQITIDTSKLPEGMTASDVYETLVTTMSNFIGDYRRPGHEYETEELVMNALVDPENEG